MPNPLKRPSEKTSKKRSLKNAFLLQNDLPNGPQNPPKTIPKPTFSDFFRIHDRIPQRTSSHPPPSRLFDGFGRIWDAFWTAFSWIWEEKSSDFPLVLKPNSDKLLSQLTRIITKIERTNAPLHQRSKITTTEPNSNNHDSPHLGPNHLTGGTPEGIKIFSYYKTIIFSYYKNVIF